MNCPSITLVATLLMLLPISCRSSDDDDGGSPVDPTELGGDDVTTVEEDITTSSDLARILVELVALADTGDLVDPEDPCITIDFAREGNQFDATGSLNACELETTRFGAVRATGTFEMSGLIRPDEDDLRSLDRSLAPWIIELDRLKAELGVPVALTELEAQYDVTNLDGLSLVDVFQSQSRIASYQHGDLMLIESVLPFRTESDLALRSEIRAGLAMGPDLSLSQPTRPEGDARTPQPDTEDEPLAPFGMVQAAFFRDQAGQEKELAFRIRLQFDGSQIAQFWVDEDGRQGRLLLSTGEVIFE